MRIDWALVSIIGLSALVIILIVGGLKLAVDEDNQWLAFAVEHHCRVVGKTSGSVGFGTGLVGGKIGTITTYIPGKTGYLCDDGVTYWR